MDIQYCIDYTIKQWRKNGEAMEIWWKLRVIRKVDYIANCSRLFVDNPVPQP
jgi:hypothetical protein